MKIMLGREIRLKIFTAILKECGVWGTLNRYGQPEVDKLDLLNEIWELRLIASSVSHSLSVGHYK